MQLVPLELRGYREAQEREAQGQYAPFRSTIFSSRSDALASRRGPGALFRDEWNALAANVQRHRPLALYRSDRVVNPTREATVQRFYDSHRASDLGTQLQHKGNLVTTLKSAVPRFHKRPEAPETATRGPGAYGHERFHGAFPTLLDKRTPQDVRAAKHEAKRAFATAFAILPEPAAVATAVPTAPSSPSRAPTVAPLHALASKLRVECSSRLGSNNAPSASDTPVVQTARLTPTLTPRNAYQNRVNRELLLAKCQANDATASLHKAAS